MGWDKRQAHFPVKATTRGLGTDLRYYEPTANATFRVVWRLEWNGKCMYTYIYIYIYIVLWCLLLLFVILTLRSLSSLLLFLLSLVVVLGPWRQPLRLLRRRWHGDPARGVRRRAEEREGEGGLCF